MRMGLSAVRRWFMNWFMTSKLKDIAVFMREVVNEFLTDNCPHLSASISYYLLFSIFPLTLALVSVLGFLSNSPQTETRVIEAIGDLLPISSEFITNSVREVVALRGATGAIATIGLLWGGTSVFNAIRKALNTAWGIRTPRPFFVERAMELGMMLGLGLLLLTSLGITTALSVVRQHRITILGMNFFNGDVFWNAILVLLTTALSFTTFLLLYKFVPNTRVRWGDVWGGALLAAVGFEVAKQIFIWYATNFAHYNLIYGPVGTTIALLVWVYVSAVILLFCAKLTSVYSRHRLSFFEGVASKGKQGLENRIQALGPTIQQLVLPGNPQTHTTHDNDSKT